MRLGRDEPIPARGAQLLATAPLGDARAEVCVGV
jgi:hypothetical protein